MSSFLKNIPSTSNLYAAYATISTFLMLLRNIFDMVVPEKVREAISTYCNENITSRFSTRFTFVIEEDWEVGENALFRASMVYLPTKIGSSIRSVLLGSKESHKVDTPPESGIPVWGNVVDEFENMRLKWTLKSRKSEKSSIWCSREKKYFHLTCNKKHRDKVMKNYFPHVTLTAKSILNSRKGLRIYTYDQDDGYWESTAFKHPSTFATLAMEPDKKKELMEDLDLFVTRKKFFERVGRTWKRGYLLYGPPGTGKSSLVAAIANHVRFNIYDLQLGSVKSDYDLRHVLTSTTNRSILLIEDIDCSSKVVQERPKNLADEDAKGKKPPVPKTQGVTLSGLLNFIDGLWSSCGEERIIIFTTNFREKLDPALRRPGRMDVHIHMGYCTPAGFRVLVSTYLGIKDHDLFEKIEKLIQVVEVSPAEVAQQIMKSDQPEVALEGLVEFLGAKREAAEAKTKKEEKDTKQEERLGGDQDNGQRSEGDMRSIYLT
uniref:AAA+ ATPase domain-containing protein n=1 Tax=Fagus sylvatica TaxID=28930 RepID=A0A2N9GQU7_FAGSY